jgi:hypothetical protein
VSKGGGGVGGTSAIEARMNNEQAKRVKRRDKFL